jgi:hypothetical protein
MKNWTRLFCGILMGLVILVTSGCEEDKLSKEELLTAHPWKFEKAETTSTNPNIQSGILLANGLLTAFGAVWTFYEDGTHVLTFTNLEPPESDEGTWELSADGKTLILTTGDEEQEEAHIKSLTSSKLVFEEELWDDEQQEFYTTTNSWVK